MKQYGGARPRQLTHIYVRHADRRFLSPCWSSGTKIFCGACQKGEVLAEIGHACPECGSTVELVFESLSNGPHSEATNGAAAQLEPAAKRVERQADVPRKVGA